MQEIIKREKQNWSNASCGDAIRYERNQGFNLNWIDQLTSDWFAEFSKLGFNEDICELLQMNHTTLN